MGNTRHRRVKGYTWQYACGYVCVYVTRLSLPLSLYHLSLPLSWYRFPPLFTSLSTHALLLCFHLQSTSAFQRPPPHPFPHLIVIISIRHLGLHLESSSIHLVASVTLISLGQSSITLIAIIPSRPIFHQKDQIDAARRTYVDFITQKHCISTHLYSRHWRMLSTQSRVLKPSTNPNISPYIARPVHGGKPMDAECSRSQQRDKSTSRGIGRAMMEENSDSEVSSSAASPCLPREGRCFCGRQVPGGTGGIYCSVGKLVWPSHAFS